MYNATIIQCVEVCAVRQTETQTRTQPVSDYALILYSAVHLLSSCTIVRVTKQGVTVIFTHSCDLWDQTVTCVCVQGKECEIFHVASKH